MLMRNLAEALSAQLVGEGSLTVERIVHPADAERASDLAVAMSAEAVASLATSKARAADVAGSVTVPPHVQAYIIAAHERSALATLTALFDRGPVHGAGVHASAIVSDDARLGEGVCIGPLVVLGPRARIGPHTVIMSNVSIGADVIIGSGGLIHSGVRIGDRVTIGDRAIVHSNAVIGSDGFSFLPARPDSPAGTASRPTRIHSLGNVIIGDDVEIGAGTAIDRATLASTRIGSGTKIDNQVQVAHNVTIGESCLICGMVGISGSTTIGDRVILAGGVGVADHITIGSDAVVAAGSGVGADVPPGAKVSGYPAMAHERTLETFLYLGRQKALHRRVEQQGQRLDRIEQSLGNKKDEG